MSTPVRTTSILFLIGVAVLAGVRAQERAQQEDQALERFRRTATCGLIQRLGHAGIAARHDGTCMGTLFE